MYLKIMEVIAKSMNNCLILLLHALLEQRVNKLQNFSKDQNKVLNNLEKMFKNKRKKELQKKYNKKLKFKLKNKNKKKIKNNNNTM